MTQIISTASEKHVMAPDCSKQSLLWTPTSAFTIDSMGTEALD